MRDFKTLKVWEKAHRLALAVYKVTRRFPKEELYGLTSQIRRACVSIPANISEGCGRSGDAEFARFLHISMGSASELEYHILLARDLQLMEEATHSRLANEISEVKHMLWKFIETLKAES